MQHLMGSTGSLSEACKNILPNSSMIYAKYTSYIQLIKMSGLKRFTSRMETPIASAVLS